jgi:DNA invertase Pin-like site-specific DNA recombinase
VNAVIYARFSSASQKEESIEGQIKVCRAYAKQHSINVIGVYTDKAKSASKDVEKRLEFQRMIEDSKKNKFDSILVYSLDRFARSRYDNAIYKYKLKKNGVRVVSATEAITDDASGILMEAVLEGMAEYYSRELSQKINRGLSINAEKCLVSGSIPLGYKPIDKKFVIDENTAPIIRKVFEMYLADYKMVDICSYLNGLGYKTRLGNDFKVTAINKILQNKRYCGYYIYKDIVVEGGIPAIISEQVFQDTAEKMAKNKKRSSASKAKGEQYLLTTKIFCGHCEAGMRGTGGYGKLKNFYQYYSCVNRVKKPQKCDKKNVPKDYIEDLVIKLCRDQLTDENINKIASEVIAICEEGKDTSNFKILEDNLKKLGKQKQKLVQSLKVGANNESFQAMIYDEFESIEKQELEIKKDILKEENLKNTLTREHILFFLTDLKNGDIRDYKYRQLLVDVFINKIFLYDDKIKIVFTTQYEKVEVDLAFVEVLEGSYLKYSSPVQSSPVQSSP